MFNSIYLIQEREFINSDENVYKIGKTKQENLKRFKQYPKGSKLILQQICDDCDILEKELISDFKNKYIHRKDIGNEYFEGDYKEMLKDIHNKITNNVVSIEETSKIDDVDNDDDNDDYNILKEIKEYEKVEDIEICIENFDDLYEIKNNIKIKEEFTKKQPYIIKNYKDYKEINPIFDSIIITNKYKQKGYIKFNKSTHWHIIYEYNAEIPLDEQECLLSWLKHNSIDEFYKDGISYYTKELFDSTYAQCMQYGFILSDTRTLCYDYDKIIKDICKTCFDDKVKLYDLQQYEYIIAIYNGYGKCNDGILNTKTRQITDYNPDTDKIITGCDFSVNIFYINKNTFQDIDTKFVGDTIKLILNNTKLYEQYKQLCYNIFVEHQKDITLTDDTCGKYGSYMVCWIQNLLYCLLPVNRKRGFIYISNKNGEKVPKKYDNDIRLIIIEYNSNINKQVAKLQQIGYKNIIIINENNYKNHIIAYENFISENMVKIKQLSEFNKTELTHSKCLIMPSPYDVFQGSRLLLNNFLKWCCEL